MLQRWLLRRILEKRLCVNMAGSFPGCGKAFLAGIWWLDIEVKTLTMGAVVT